MKKISDLMSQIATDLEILYIRSMNLTDADYEIHHEDSGQTPFLIYEGAGNVALDFGDAGNFIARTQTTLYVVGPKTQKDDLATNVDLVLAQTYDLATSIYAKLNKADIMAEDIAEWNLEAIQMFTDMYVGYKIETTLNIFNKGC